MALDRDTNTLVVFGGFNVEKNSQGVWCTTTHFLSFLQALAERFDKVVFVTWENPAPVGYQSEIQGKNIEVLALPPGLRHRLSLMRQLLRLVRGSHFWMHLPNGICLFPIMPLLCRLAKSVTVYLANDYVGFFQCSRYQRIPGGRWYFFRAHEYPMQKARQVIARGRKLALQALQFNKNTIETIPIVRLPSRSSSSGPVGSPPKAITYIGQMLWGKGLRELISAFADLKEKNPTLDVQLHLVGAGQDSEEIREYAESRIEAKHLKIFGWLDSAQQLEEVWSQARVLVVPSCTYAEGVPRTIDEALVRKIPVVATRIGGIAEEYEKGEVALVTPGSAEEIGLAIERLVSDPELVKEMMEVVERRLARWEAYENAGHQHADIILSDPEKTRETESHNV